MTTRRLIRRTAPLVLAVVAVLVLWPAAASALTALDWMRDAQLCGETFGGATWEAGRALVASIFALPMSADMLAIFAECTGRLTAPVKAFARAVVIAGRGSGKTLLSAFVVVYIAASRDWHAVMGPGELVTAALVCPDRRQARVALRYIFGLLRGVPMLERLIVSSTKESVTLSTGCVIEVHTASFKSTRGYSFCAVVIDEAAFLPTDQSASPDVELVRAVTPGLARVPGSLLLAISSPFGRRGVLWDMWKRYHAVDDAPVLVWQADTRTMNPTIAQSVVDDALADDEAAAKSEWLGLFRTDLEAYIAREVVEAVTVAGREELPPVSTRRYVAFVDPSGGSRDSMTFAIAHGADGKAVLDVLYEHKPPFDPSKVVAEIAAICGPYGIRTIVGDRYAGEWPRERFKEQGLKYEPSERTKSEIYAELLPLLNSRRVELLDLPRLHAQLLALDRSTSRGGRGRDIIDHPPNGFDDACNAAAGALIAVRLGPPLLVRPHTRRQNIEELIPKWHA
jgi:hypothetical protein